MECRQEEIGSLIRLEIIIKRKQKVQFKETKKYAISSNQDIDILTSNCCNF